MCTVYTLPSCLPYFRQCALKTQFVGSFAVRGIDEVKTKNVLSFGQHSKRKRTQTRYFLFTKHSKKCENVTMASLTCVCFVPAKGLIRGLSANSKNFIDQMCAPAKYHEK